jgi:hypothetical protein
MLVFLLIVLIGGLGGFGYWAYTQGYLKAIPFLKSASDNSTTGSNSGGPKLTVPPTISDIKVNAGFVDGANITWSTDQLASGQVEYGAFGTFTTKSTIDTDPVGGKNAGSVTHGITLKGLTASTKYQYRVISHNKDGIEAVSSTNDFTTASQ